MTEAEKAYLTAIRRIKRIKLKNSTALELFWDEELEDIPAKIKELINLNRLYISQTQISDLNHIANLTQLTHLDASHTKINDLSALKNLTNLTSLDISQTGIHDLTPLTNLSKIKNLQIFHTQVRNLQPIANLIKSGIEVKWSKWDGYQGIYVKDCPLKILQ